MEKEILSNNNDNGGDNNQEESDNSSDNNQLFLIYDDIEIDKNAIVSQKQQDVIEVDERYSS